MVCNVASGFVNVGRDFVLVARDVDALQDMEEVNVRAMLDASSGSEITET